MLKETAHLTQRSQSCRVQLPPKSEADAKLVVPKFFKATDWTAQPRLD